MYGRLLFAGKRGTGGVCAEASRLAHRRSTTPPRNYSWLTNSTKEYPALRIFSATPHARHGHLRRISNKPLGSKDGTVIAVRMQLQINGAGIYSLFIQAPRSCDPSVPLCTCSSEAISVAITIYDDLLLVFVRMWTSTSQNGVAFGSTPRRRLFWDAT